MTIADSVKERAIQEVLHFTTNRGLVGLLTTGFLRSRRRLNSDEYLKNVLHKNAIYRPETAPTFDKGKDWLDYVNLSITAINASYMGFSKNWPHNQSIWWCILAFDPEILSHDGVFFATTNNAYEHCSRASGEEGFQALFAPVVRRKGSWSVVRGRRSVSLPTCQQAEVLYPGEVSASFLRRIYVQSPEDGDRARGWLREYGPAGVEVLLDDNTFRGVPN